MAVPKPPIPKPPVPNPTAKSLSQIKSSLLNPALTSHYELYLSIPDGNAGDFNKIMQKNGVDFSSEQSNLQLACSEATLPGSSLATLEINNDYTGVTERHAYRRIYDDRIDLTFYVDTKYTVIKFFETWIKYIMSESISGGGEEGPVGLAYPNFFYSVRYPEEYQTKFSIVKFERDYGSKLTYTFLKAFPISISSMPISYDSSSLLKCTVSFTYSRYFIEDLNGSAPTPTKNEEKPQSSLNNPLEQSNFNTESYKTLTNKTSTNDFLNIGNPALDQFGVRDQFGRGAEGTVGANILT